MIVSDFDMDKKITRRVVLGTAVTALAVAPFIVRSYRSGANEFSI